MKSFMTGEGYLTPAQCIVASANLAGPCGCGNPNTRGIGGPAPAPTPKQDSYYIVTVVNSIPGSGGGRTDSETCISEPNGDCTNTPCCSGMVCTHMGGNAYCANDDRRQRHLRVGDKTQKDEPQV